MNKNFAKMEAVERRGALARVKKARGLARFALSVSLGAVLIFLPMWAFASSEGDDFGPRSVALIMACAGVLTLIMLIRRRRT